MLPSIHQFSSNVVVCQCLFSPLHKNGDDTNTNQPSANDDDSTVNSATNVTLATTVTVIVNWMCIKLRLHLSVIELLSVDIAFDLLLLQWFLMTLLTLDAVTVDCQKGVFVKEDRVAGLWVDEFPEAVAQ